MSIFEGLEKFGLGHLKNTPLEVEKPAEGAAAASQKKEINPKDFIFEKIYDCPVCDKQFKAFTVKNSKLKLESINDNLRPIYSPIDPLFYDAIVCTNCGYSALKQNFTSITERQADIILKTIKPNFKPVFYPELMDVDMAIECYKLALVNSAVKRAKESEKGFICMKISWLYEIKGDVENELMFVKQAYDSFNSAFSSETPPMFGLDENTLIYLLSMFAFKLKNLDDSLRLLPKVITSKTVTPRLKDRAIDLKDRILAEKAKAAK